MRLSRESSTHRHSGGRWSGLSIRLESDAERIKLLGLCKRAYKHLHEFDTCSPCEGPSDKRLINAIRRLTRQLEDGGTQTYLTAVIAKRVASVFDCAGELQMSVRDQKYADRIAEGFFKLGYGGSSYLSVTV